MKQLAALIFFILTSCQPSLKEHAKVRPYAESSFFSDKKSVREWPEGVVPRDNQLPLQLSEETLRRGQQRFNINCQACHGLDGSGDGMAVQRGFPPPPSYHTDSSRKLSIEDIYNIISNGRGLMFPMKNRVREADRWAIAYYVRALQLQKHFPAAALTKDDLKKGANP